MQLTVSEDLAQEIDIDLSGKATISIRGAAKLLGVSDVTLSRQFRVLTGTPSKLSQKLIEQGFDPANLSEQGIPDLALPILCFYYAVEAQKCTKEAKHLLQLFSTIGARVCLQKAKGWEPQILPKTYVPPNIDPIPLPCAPMSERTMIVRMVVSYSKRQDKPNPLNEQETWRWMYRELKYRYRYDVYARLKKAKKAGDLKTSKLDLIERDNQISNLLAVCNHLIPLTNP